MRLAEYPYVVVRLSCELCGRHGQYRLARLAARFGPETDLGAILQALTADCEYQSVPGRPKRKYDARCKAAFPDLAGPPRPPDLPPAMAGLRVVQGGKRPAGG